MNKQPIARNVKVNGYSNAGRLATKKRKREEHFARVETWGKKSPKEQIADLDTRFGKGNGATKQRARIVRKQNSN